jgi:CRP/FNR family transcriptional regulator, cyclic AMP receptor protein
LSVRVTRRFLVPLEEHSEDVLFLPEASASDWARILGHAQLYRVEPGDEIIRAGDDDRALWFVAEGTVRVVSGDDTVSTIEAPSVLGELAFLDGGRRAAGLVAETEGEVARFDMEAFDALASEDEDLARRMALGLGRIAALRLRAIEAARRA